MILNQSVQLLRCGRSANRTSWINELRVKEYKLQAPQNNTRAHVQAFFQRLVNGVDFLHLMRDVKTTMLHPLDTRTWLLCVAMRRWRSVMPYLVFVVASARIPVLEQVNRSMRQAGTEMCTRINKPLGYTNDCRRTRGSCSSKEEI